MSISDRQLLGLRGEQAGIDRRNAGHMYRSHGGGGHDPYYLDCPLDAIEDVARGLRPGCVITFLWHRHIIRVGEQEWLLDGALGLWREASMYAEHLREHRLLSRVRENGRTEYHRKGS